MKKNNSYCSGVGEDMHFFLAFVTVTAAAEAALEPSLWLHVNNYNWVTMQSTMNGYNHTIFYYYYISLPPLCVPPPPTLSLFLSSLSLSLSNILPFLPPSILSTYKDSVRSDCIILNQ